MLRINIICVGKIKEKYINLGIEDYLKRLKRFVKINIIELKDENDENLKIAKLKETEALILELSKNEGYTFLLDIKGENLSSEELSSKISKLSLTNSSINFVIGGSNGYLDTLRKKSNFKISFSKMTFPHRLMRLILLEQIYRALTIINNIKYHK